MRTARALRSLDALAGRGGLTHHYNRSGGRRFAGTTRLPRPKTSRKVRAGLRLGAGCGARFHCCL